MVSDPDLAATVRDFFVRDGWNLADDAGDEAAVRVVAQGERGRWPLGVWVFDQRVVVYSTIPEEIAPNQRPAVAELLGDLNSGMLLGCFELGSDDEYVRFRTSIGVRGVEVTDQLLRELVYPNVATVERYLEAVTGCATGALSLAAARQLAE